MEKEQLLSDLRTISKMFFDKKDYFGAGRINQTIGIIESDKVLLPQANVSGNEVALTFEQRQCPSCKLNIQLEDKFCSHCGVKFKWQ